MIYHQPGEEFWHEGVCYKVGGRIVANEASDYAGLFGNILEIRTEDDRETDNDTPDIYCAFEAPVTVLRWSRPFHSFTVSRNTSRIWAWIWSLWGLK